MPSYVITGVSKGIGWAFLDQLSSDANNTVIGIVRNKPPTEKRVAEELAGRSNITILEADLTSYDALKKASADTAAITGGSLDYLIANAAYVPKWDAFDGIGVLETKPEFTEEFHKVMDTNVLANIHLYSLFMPQILNGKTKKVLFISSGAGDIDWVRDYDIQGSTLYAMSKAAMNLISAKFSAQYKKDGVLFLSICPGMVDVGYFSHLTTEQIEAMEKDMVNKFKDYSPDFNGASAPPDAVKAVLSVLESCSIENGDGGAFLSHYGNKTWI